MESKNRTIEERAKINALEEAALDPYRPSTWGRFVEPNSIIGRATAALYPGTAPPLDRMDPRLWYPEMQGRYAKQ